jgi:hypothetical protein
VYLASFLLSKRKEGKYARNTSYSFVLKTWYETKIAIEVIRYFLNTSTSKRFACCMRTPIHVSKDSVRDYRIPNWKACPHDNNSNRSVASVLIPVLYRWGRGGGIEQSLHHLQDGDSKDLRNVGNAASSTRCHHPGTGWTLVMKCRVNLKSLRKAVDCQLLNKSLLHGVICLFALLRKNGSRNIFHLLFSL